MRHRQQAFGQQAQGDGEGGQFRRRAQQQGHGRRRTLIHVRHPHVEWHDAQFEGQASDQEHQAEDHDGAVGLAVFQRHAQFAQVQGAGSAVQHRDTVQHETGSQCAQDEVFHGRFRGLGIVTAQSDQCVQRQRHQFQTQVDDQEVVGRDHDHLAQQCKQGQHVELAAQVTRQHAAVGGIGTRVDQGQRHGAVREQFQQLRHRVRHEHVVERVDGGARVEVAHGQQGAACQSQQRQRIGDRTLRRRQEHIDQQERRRGDQQKDFRVQRYQIRCISHVIGLLFKATCWWRHAAAGRQPKFASCR